MKFEYISSATSMFGMPTHDENTNIIVNEYLKDLDFKYGFLFNAMTEEKFGVKYYNKYDASSIHADSGGLQIATLGLDKEKTKEKQAEIYKTQAKFSNIGMIFDDMPLEFTHQIGGNQSRLDISNRRFIHSRVKEVAESTAENVKKQINTFIDLESKAKVMLICQGNDRDSYKQYVETIYNSLSPEQQSYVYGLAPSGACNGVGDLERFDMLYTLKEYDLPDEIKSHIHLLGVGSIKALTPLLGSTDYFSFIDTLSFDSSSASRNYKIDGKGLGDYQFNKLASKEEYSKGYMDIIKKYGKYFMMTSKLYNQKWDLEYFIENCTYYSSKNVDKVWSWRNKEYPLAIALSDLLWFFVTADNVERVMNNLNQRINTKYPILDGISTWEDYQKNRTNIIKKYRLGTNKIKSHPTMEEFNKGIEIQDIIKGMF